MDTTKYRSKSIYVEHINRATKLGMSINEYITSLIKHAEQNKTFEQTEQSSKLESLIGTVSSLAEALKYQRYITDAQSKKIDDQSELVTQLIEMQNKLINAYGADVEFIKVLKQEITQ